VYDVEDLATELIKMEDGSTLSLGEGKEPITSALSGFTNNLVLDAIYESSRTGHEVKLNWS
jgi:hypothetical protein